MDEVCEGGVAKEAVTSGDAIFKTSNTTFYILFDAVDVRLEIGCHL